MCDVYKAKYELENKSGLEMDMRVEAKQKVFNILDSYKKHCEK
jgi:hypothetical protein